MGIFINTMKQTIFGFNMKKGKKMFNLKSIIFMCVYITFFSIILTVPHVSLAQTSNNEKKSTYEESKKKILEKQAQLKEEITKVTAAIELKAQDELERPTSISKQRLEILLKVDLVYEQQLIQIKRSVELIQTAVQLREELSAILAKKTVPEPPYSFFLLDEYKEKLILLEEQRGSIAETVTSAEDSFQSTKDKLRTSDQSLRQIKEELEAEKKAVITSPAFIIAESNNRLAREEVNLQKRYLENVRFEEDIHHLKLELLNEKISFVESLIQFSRKELQDRIFKIEKDAITLKNNLEKAKTKEDLANSRWLNAKKQLVDKTVSPDEIEKKEKEIVNWKVWDDTYQLEVEILSQQIKYLDDSKKIWQYRYALFHKTESVDLAGWEKETEQTLEQLEREKRLLIVRQTDCLNEILSLEKELESAKEASKTTWHIEEQLKAFKTKENLFKKGLESIQSTQREFQKLKKDIAIEEKHKTIKERLSNLLIIVRQVSQYEITSIEDHPITVGKVILALVLLIAGFLFSHRLTAKMGKQLIKRVGLTEPTAFAFQQIIHYLVLVLLVLFVLNYVRIPLTFFTVVGGALAIGVGFGSQNIVNNFLSGLILMMERPIKIGDIVEVENVRGTVEWVGARSTRIKTFDNLRLVVPNSTLLQNKVINWSLSDDIVRREIIVGVQYGSPVRKVESLLQQAASEHSVVEKYPKPIVLFDDFGDNALIFMVLIWVRMSRTGMAHLYISQVESDIRFRIDELFRQNDIVIAFPQRDVHIDTLKPLEVRVKNE